MTDLGVVQSPMFHTTPVSLAYLLPAYAPTRVTLDGAFSSTFHATGDLLLPLGWLAALTVATPTRRKHHALSHTSATPGP